MNLFHGMEETDHVHITFIQESRVTAYQKQWPNHIFACLPDSFTNASDSAVKNIMKVRILFVFLVLFPIKKNVVRHDFLKLYPMIEPDFSAIQDTVFIFKENISLSK